MWIHGTLNFDCCKVYYTYVHTFLKEFSVEFLTSTLKSYNYNNLLIVASNPDKQTQQDAMGKSGL
jgi:hypothetical protein